MSAQNDNREITILESKGILIKDQMYHVVLTDRRIILTSFFDHKPRSINLPDVQKTELAINDYGDPIIIVFAPSVAGEIKKVILHFSKKNFTDPQMVSSLWSSEINKMIQRIVPVSPDITPKVSPGITPKVSPDITPKKGSPIPAFCIKCGTKFVDGSVFCNKCGSKIIYPAQPIPLQQGEESIRENVKTPDISMGKIEIKQESVKPEQPKQEPVKPEQLKQEPVKPEQEKISLSAPDNSATKEKVPVAAPLKTDPPGKISGSTPSGKRKTAIIAVSALVGIILLIAVFFVLVPSVLPVFNLTFPGMNFTVPESSVTASATVPLVPTTTIATTTRTLATPVQTSTPVRTTATPVRTSTPQQTTTTPTQTSIPAVVIVPPLFTTVPGDPWSVFISYPSLFNAGNAAGIFALLSENMKSHYPLDSVNNELATARSNGYSIEKIQGNNQIIEEDSAILEVEITWKISGSPQTSTPRFYLVYENNQWKLDSLIVNPYTS